MKYFAGNQPPGVNPTKMQYIAKDLMRLANHTQVPMKLPSVSYLLHYLHTRASFTFLMILVYLKIDNGIGLGCPHDGSRGEIF